MDANDRSVTGAGSANGLDPLVAVRLIQIHAYTVDAEATPFIDRAEKSRLLGELVDATSKIPDEIQVPPHLESLAQLANDDTLVASIEGMARVLRPRLTDHEKRVALIEAVASTAWPKGISWVMDRSAVLAEKASLLVEPIRTEDVARLEKAYKSAIKRLQRDSTAPGAQATQMAVMAALTTVSGGAATSIGTFVGTHFLGLSGAAATSAGLALLGGGSLASGGFGMTGGLFLLQSAMHVAKFGGKQAFSHLASVSPSTFLETLAKLDVLVALDPSFQPKAIGQLEQIEADLQAKIETVQPKDLSGRRVRIAQNVLRGVTQPMAIPTVVREVRTETSPEERHLARALRAVDFELRHLRSSTWKRQVSRLPRMAGVPSASKLLDRL